MTAVIRNTISAVILVALTYLILQALPAAIDQNLKSCKQLTAKAVSFASQATRLVAYGRFTAPLPRLAITIAAFKSALVV